MLNNSLIKKIEEIFFNVNFLNFIYSKESKNINFSVNGIKSFFEKDSNYTVDTLNSVSDKAVTDYNSVSDYIVNDSISIKNEENEFIFFSSPDGSVYLKSNGIIFAKFSYSGITFYREAEFWNCRFKNFKSDNFLVEIKNSNEPSIVDGGKFVTDAFILPINNEFVSKEEYEIEKEFLVNSADKINEKIFEISKIMKSDRSLSCSVDKKLLGTDYFNSVIGEFVSEPFNVIINYLSENMTKILKSMEMEIVSDSLFFLNEEPYPVEKIDISFKNGRLFLTNSPWDNLSSITLKVVNNKSKPSNFKINCSVLNVFGEFFQETLEFDINNSISIDVENILKYNGSDIMNDYEIPMNSSGSSSNELLVGFSTESSPDYIGYFLDKESGVNYMMKELEIKIFFPKKYINSNLVKNLEFESYDNSTNLCIINAILQPGVEILYYSKNNNALKTGILDNAGRLRSLKASGVFFSSELMNCGIKLECSCTMEDGKKTSFIKNIKFISNGNFDDSNISIDEKEDLSEMVFKTGDGPDDMLEFAEKSLVFSAKNYIRISNENDLLDNSEVVGIMYKIYDSSVYLPDGITTKLPSQPITLECIKSAEGGFLPIENSKWSYDSEKKSFYFRVSRETVNKNLYIEATIKTVYFEEFKIKKIIKIIPPTEELGIFLNNFKTKENEEIVENILKTNGEVTTSCDMKLDIIGELFALESINLEISGGSKWQGIENNFMSFDITKVHNSVSGVYWKIANTSSSAVINNISIMEKEKNIHLNIKKVFVNTMENKTKIKISYKSIFSYEKFYREFFHNSKIMLNDFFSLEVINPSRPAGMPAVFKISKIKNSNSSVINGILSRKKLKMNLENRDFNTKSVFFDEDANKLGFIENDSYSTVISNDVIYAVFMDEGDVSEKKLQLSMSCDGFEFFSKEVSSNNYRKVDNFVLDKFEVKCIDGDDLNKEIVITLKKYFKFAEEISLVLDVYSEENVMLKNFKMNFRDSDYLDAGKYESYIAGYENMECLDILEVVNMSMINKSSMYVVLKEVFVRLKKSSVSTNNDQVSKILNSPHCFLEFIGPVEFNKELSLPRISLKSEKFSEAYLEEV